MKYTCCEAMMWAVLSPACFRILAAEHPEWPSFKKRAKQIYRAMAARTPETGALAQNSLRICLASGMVWLSIYEAAEGRMEEACFAQMVLGSMNTRLIRFSFKGKGKAAFTHRGQQKRKMNAEKSNALASGPFGWKTDVVFGRDEDEFTIFYHQCGLCALGRQEGLFHLVRHMCVVDTLSVEWMGGALYRTKTLAAEEDCCDFYICRKDSHWDRARREAEKGKENEA